MKIVLIGFNGRMGKEIQECLCEGDEIVQKIDKETKLNQKTYGDVIIDFSTAKNRNDFIKYSLRNKIPYCCFATNLTVDDINNFEKLSKQVPVLLCSNASVGVNAMFDIIKLATEKIKKADIVIEEYHHKNKIDKPSGTARRIENIFKENDLKFETQSYRVGNECGTHIVQFFMEDQTYCQVSKSVCLGSN